MSVLAVLGRIEELCHDDSWLAFNYTDFNFISILHECDGIEQHKPKEGEFTF